MKKRIAIFCDGTWNSADQVANGEPSPTNVVKLALRVARHGYDGIPQVVYYGQGVGTGGSIDKLTGGAFGKGLDDNLYAAYRFLVLNYRLGDEILLFGFSRGAYTARSLAGMIRKCGILRLDAASQYQSALNVYCNEHHPDDDSPAHFRCEFSVMENKPTPIEFIGVWDTVGALGVPVRGLRWLTRDKYSFHDVELSSSVKRAAQALAIDERRDPFEAARWAYIPKQGQEIQQVWFCGVHSDIGGGYAETGLSDIALEWMRDLAADAGLRIDPQVDKVYAPKPDHRATPHDSKTGLYRLTPGIDRVIGIAATEKKQPDSIEGKRDMTQSLHPSVIKRWDEDPKYRPKNLRDYFKLICDPRSK